VIINLTEHGSAIPVSLSRDEVEALQQTNAVTVTPCFNGQHNWMLKASNMVGVIVLGNDLEVRIRPKIEMDRLLFLAVYARDDKAWRQEVTDLGVKEDLISSMGWAFAHFLEEALGRGVLQGYVSVDNRLAGIRGRIRESDQLRRHFGMVLPVEVTYDDLTIDIIENQILLSASQILLGIPNLPAAVRMRLLRLQRYLDGVSSFDRNQVQQEVIFTSVNDRYRSVVTLAQLILKSVSVEHTSGSKRAISFLFNMNTLFEDFVTKALGRSLERIDGHVQPQFPTALDARQVLRIKPDLVWWQDGSSHAVIDAKYKATRVDAVPNADVYQAIAYSLALDVRPAFLVYAAGDEVSSNHRVVNSDLSVVVMALDLSGTPAEILTAVDELASEIELISLSRMSKVLT
jgi:5-methylcytosine-specific restriction enzyme subunit McrC